MRRLAAALALLFLVTSAQGQIRSSEMAWNLMPFASAHERHQAAEQAAFSGVTETIQTIAQRGVQKRFLLFTHIRGTVAVPEDFPYEWNEVPTVDEAVALYSAHQRAALVSAPSGSFIVYWPR